MSRDALVVGINIYSYERLNNLKAPARDAEAVAQLLEKYGDFKVTRLPAVKDKENDTIKVGKKSAVSVKKLREAIVQLFLPPSSPPDTALLYFSGHGLREELGISEGFLASSNVNPDLNSWGVSLKWLREVLQKSEVKQQIIILDCCYSGELLNFTEADPGDRGKGRDRCFFAASRPFEVAYEEIDNQHSVFTNALITGLEPLQDKWVTNYTLVDLLNQEHHSFPQRPIFANSGEPINLTRRWTAAVQNSPQPRQTICPYKGLRYFDCIEEDAKYFYGRTALIDELLEKVRSGNFLAVLGASGSGKSSVVRAGLLYQLKLGRRLSDSEKWLIKIFQPGEHPLQSLALAFLDPELSSIERASQLAIAEELITKGADGLRQLVTSFVTDDTHRLVLVIDQFEEAFTLCKDDLKRQEFFECLLWALPQCGDKLCLVLTMRSDFFGKCTEQEYCGLAQQIQQNLVTVTPMTRDELEQAIIKPVKQVELEIEPELVKQMLVDVANAPGILPLLQDTLTELWKKRTDNCLQLKTYSQLGGVMGNLRQRATAVYESFSLEEKATCKHIFLALTQLGEGTEDTRRLCFQEDLVNKRYSEELINRVIQRLADEKLIITSEIVAKGGASERFAVVDVAHEALIRHWLTLRLWLEEDRNKLRLQRQIEQASRLWRQSGEKADFLLQGVRLAEAEDIYIKYTDELSDDVQNFIEACLAERQQQQIQEKRRFKRAQRAVFALSVLGIAAFSFAGLAYLQGRSAKLREIQALNSSSTANLLSNKQLESLIASVKAAKQLKQVIAVPEDIKTETVNKLQEVIAKIQEYNRLEGHNGAIYSVKFSHDGKMIASAGADKTVKIWRHDGKLLRTLKGHKATVHMAVFSPNSKTIASASADKTVKLWRVSDGKLLKTLKGHNRNIFSLSWSTQDNIVASGSMDGNIKIWKANDGKLLNTIKAHEAPITSVSFSPDGETLISGSHDKSIKLWNVSDGKYLREINGHKDIITKVYFSTDGKKIFSGSTDKSIKLWNVNDGKLIKEIKRHTDAIEHIAFSPDGQIIASAIKDRSIKILSSNGIQLEALQGHTDSVNSISFNPKNQTLASASVDGTIRIWKIQSYKTKILLGHSQDVYDVSWNPNGSMIASADIGGKIKLWRHNGNFIKNITGSGSPVYSISFAPDGNTIASAHADKTVRIWRISDSELLRKISGHNDIIGTVRFSHDGTTIATASRDKTVKIWSNINGKLIYTINAHKAAIHRISFNPSDNHTIISGSEDGTIKVWNYRDGSFIKSISAKVSPVIDLSLSPNGKIIASSHFDKTVKLWNFNKSKLITTLTGHPSIVYRSTFSPNGQMIASSSSDKRVKLWHIGGRLLKILPEHSNGVTSLSFSPDSKTLISGSLDTTVRLWEIDAEQVKTLKGDSLIMDACNWLHDYLNHNSKVDSQDKTLCEH